MEYNGGITLNNVSCNFFRNDFHLASQVAWNIKLVWAQFLHFKRISPSRLKHYSNTFYRLITYLYIPDTCIWLPDICMFPYMDRRQTQSFLHAADIPFCRYTLPARFEENCWRDSLCCSYVNGDRFVCPACHSSRQARRYFFCFDILWILCGSHKWQQSVSLQKLKEKEGRGVERDINNVQRKS